jgi:hypothetical protein
VQNFCQPHSLHHFHPLVLMFNTQHPTQTLADKLSWQSSRWAGWAKEHTHTVKVSCRKQGYTSKKQRLGIQNLTNTQKRTNYDSSFGSGKYSLRTMANSGWKANQYRKQTSDLAIQTFPPWNTQFNYPTHECDLA